MADVKNAEQMAHKARKSKVMELVILQRWPESERPAHPVALLVVEVQSTLL
jgi:hypothetical protein